MSNSNTVLIKGLELTMSIGIYEQEKQAPQRVLVSIEMDVSHEGTDNIDQVVSYETVVNGVHELATQRHYDLVEDFAEHITALCLKDQRVSRARVSVEKPDVFDHAASVGIRIERNR